MSSVGERGVFTQMLVVASFWGCFNHSRVNEVTKEHPHDITVALFMVWPGKGF